MIFDWGNVVPECPAGGCDNTGRSGDFEHAPYRCGLCVLCGACGMVLQRPPRRGARDAPRFWSQLDARDGVVTSLMVMQRKAAWDTYAQLMNAQSEQTQQFAGGHDGGDERRHSEGEEEAASNAACSDDGRRAADEQQPRGGGQAGSSAGASATPPAAACARARTFSPVTASGRAQAHDRATGAAGTASRYSGARYERTTSPARPRQLFRDEPPPTRSPAEKARSATEHELPAWLQEAQHELAATRRPATRRAPARAVPLGAARARDVRLPSRVNAFFAAARVLRQQRPPLPGQAMAEEERVRAEADAAAYAAARAEEERQARAAASLQLVWRWRRRRSIAAAEVMVAEAEASAEAALARVEACAEQAMSAAVAVAEMEAEAAGRRAAVAAEEAMTAAVAEAAPTAARAAETVAPLSPNAAAPKEAEEPAMWDAVFAEQAWLAARFGGAWPQQLEQNLQQSRRLWAREQNRQEAREVGRALVRGWREQEQELRRQGLRLPLGRGSGGRQQRRSRTQRQGGPDG